MRKIVGFSQKTKRAWLDALLDKLVQTTDKAELRKFLNDYLKDDLPGKESRAKSAGIILRIWSGVPPARLALRDRAVAMLPRIHGQERIWLHWGMTALAYPFFRDTAEVVGRLLALQDDFTTGQVQGRMLTTWGDRATTKEAAQKLLNTLVDWEVLRSTKAKGHFLLTRKMTASIPDLQLWLLEAMLVANEADEIEAQQLLRLPETFPFSLSVGVADLRRHEGFNIHRQGLDMDMVALRPVRVQPPPKPANKSKSKKPTKANGPSLFDKQPEETAGANGSQKVISVSPVTKQAVEPDKRNVPARPPENPFAAPLVECAEEFREGRYFGCIALSQVLLVAIIRHVWQIRLKKKPNQEGSFEKNLAALHKKKLIGDDLKGTLDQVWADRHSFHHLRPAIASDRQKLEDTAHNALALLEDLNRVFFKECTASNPS